MALYFVRDKADMKYLILCLLDSAEEGLDWDILFEAAQTDEGVNYFIFTEALSELIKAGAVTREGDRLEFAPSGREVFKYLGNMIPTYAQHKARECVVRALARSRRDACIETSTEPVPEGGTGFTTTLAMTDGAEDIMRLRLMTVSKEQGKELERNFRANAEKIFNGIVDAVTKNYEQNGENK